MLNLKRESVGVSAARGASYLWLQNITLSVSQIVAFAFFARLISVGQMGVFTILSLGYGAASSFMGLGLSSIVSKLVAENLAKGRKVEAASVYYKALVLSELASGLIALLFLGSKFPVGISGLPNSPEVSVIGILFALDVIANIGPSAAAALYGLLEFKGYALLYGVYGTIRPWLVVLLVYEVRSLSGLVGAWVISDSVLAIYVFMYLWRRLGPPVFRFNTRHLLKLSSPLYLSSVAAFFYGSFDQLALIPLTSLTALGIYGAAVKAFSTYTGFVSVLGSVLLPVFSGVRGVRGPDALTHSVKVASRYACFVAMPMAFALLATAKPALTLLVGVQYAGGAIPLAVLSLASIAGIIALALNPVLIVLDETWQAALTSLIPLPVSVALALVAIPVLGILGAGIARGLAMVLSLGLSWYFVQRKLPIRLDYSAIIKSIIAGAVMALIMQAIELVHYSRFLLPVYLAVGLITYLLALRALRALNRADVSFMRKTLGRRLQWLCTILSLIAVA